MKKILSFLAVVAMMSFGIANAQERFVSEEPQNRKALLEEYTGFQCVNCPDGHRRANALHEKYPEDLFLINIHTGPFANPPSGSGAIDMRTAYGEDLAKEAGGTSFPSGSVNRHIFNNGANRATSRIEWATNVPIALMMSSPVNIAAKGTLDWESRTLSVTVQTYYTGNSQAATNYVHVAVVQDNIVGPQMGANNNPAQVLPDGQYIHNHVLRDLITGLWGDAVSPTAQASFREKTYTKVLPESINNINLELSDLQVIAFVTESRNEVLTVCKVEIEHKNAPSHYVKLSDMKQAPDNTCDDSVRFSFNIETTIASEPITSIVFNCETPSGIQEFEYKPENGLTASNTYTLTTPSLAITQREVEQHFSMKISKINGNDYPFDDHNMVEADAIKLLALTPTHNINVNIWQDKNGSDITWQLQEINGDVLASGGPYDDLRSNNTALRTAQATLADGCYAFTIYDKRKDGINSTYGAGHLSITDSLDRPIMEHDGKYKDSLRYLVRFDVNSQPVNNETEQVDYHALLAPNPANGYSMLSFELPAAQTLRVRLIANNGACALDLGNMNLSAGKQSILLPTDKLAEGLYMVHVSGQTLSLTQKLIIVR